VQAVSPAVEAYSHEEGCRQYCASVRSAGCTVASVSRDGPPFISTGNLDCNVPIKRWDGSIRAFRLVEGAARIQCPLGQILLEDVISCACQPGKRWNGSACIDAPELQLRPSAPQGGPPRRTPDSR